MPLKLPSVLLPFGPDMQYTSEKPTDPITLIVYEGTNGKFAIYEDENVNNNYEKGKFIQIDISWDNTSKTLTIDKQKGGFDGMLKKRTFNIIYISSDKPKGYPFMKMDRSIVYTGDKIEVKK
jgi:alpha-D-xyloside xylohydrolase